MTERYGQTRTNLRLGSAGLKHPLGRTFALSLVALLYYFCIEVRGCFRLERLTLDRPAARPAMTATHGSTHCYPRGLHASALVAVRGSGAGRHGRGVLVPPDARLPTASSRTGTGAAAPPRRAAGLVSSQIGSSPRSFVDSPSSEAQPGLSAQSPCYLTTASLLGPDAEQSDVSWPGQLPLRSRPVGKRSASAMSPRSCRPCLRAVLPFAPMRSPRRLPKRRRTSHGSGPDDGDSPLRAPH